MTKAMLTRSFKDALNQSLRENRDAVRDLLAEVIEDVAMVNAIRAGERSKSVKRDAVMKALAARNAADSSVGTGVVNWSRSCSRTIRSRVLPL